MQKRTVWLSLLAFVLGLVCLSLEMLLIGTADGLVARRHPAGIAVILLCVLVPVILLVLSHKAGTAEVPAGRAVFRGISLVPGILAVGSLSSSVYGRMTGALPLILLGLGILAVAGLAIFSLLPEKYRQTRCLAMSVACLFYSLQVLCNFRISGNDPQIHDYILPVLAGACLMVFSFHAAANALEGKEEQAFSFWRLTGLFFCTAALYTGGLPFAAADAWLLLCTPSGAAEGISNREE